jgi:hypothetical protein
MALHWWTLGFNFSQRLRLASRLLRHFLTSPYTEVTRRSSSELIRTMNDAVGNAFNLWLAGVLTWPNPRDLDRSRSSSACWLSHRSRRCSSSPTSRPRPSDTCSSSSPAPLAAGQGDDRLRPSVPGITPSPPSSACGSCSCGVRPEVFVARYATRRRKPGGALLDWPSSSAAFPGSCWRSCSSFAVGAVIAHHGRPVPAGGSTVGLLALFVAAGFRILPSVTALLGSISQISVGSGVADHGPRRSERGPCRGRPPGRDAGRTAPGVDD